MKLKSIFLMGALGIILFASPKISLATFAVSINGVQCNDGDACDTNTAANNITFAQNLASNTLILTNTSFTNTPGSAGFGIVDMTYSVNNIAGASAQAVVFLASATGFTIPAAGSASTLTSTISGTLSPPAGTMSLTAQQWVNLSDTLFGKGAITPGVQGPFTSTFTNTATVGFTSATPYSITDQLNVTIGANSAVTGDLSSTTVPEPASMLLFGLGLVGLGIWGRKRLSK